MAKSDTALVFATDETFAPLAKGLVLSIVAQARPGEFDFKLVDIGCSQATLDWMRGYGVEIGKFARDALLPASRTATKSYQNAMFCRPFIPEMFPGYENYLWCDSDIWIQDIASLRLYVTAIEDAKHRVSIAPIVDPTYTYILDNFVEYSTYSRIWYDECYGPTVSSTYFNRAVFSAGVFAMKKDCRIWQYWKAEIKAMLGRRFSSHVIFHLAEQTALNYLLYSHDLFVPMAADHNYNCHMGGLVRNNRNAVVIERAPFRQVGVVHLTSSARMMPDYIQRGLLFDSGRYLSEAEKAGLLQLSHY